MFWKEWGMQMYCNWPKTHLAGGSLGIFPWLTLHPMSWEFLLQSSACNLCWPLPFSEVCSVQAASASSVAKGDFTWGRSTLWETHQETGQVSVILPGSTPAQGVCFSSCAYHALCPWTQPPLGLYLFPCAVKRKEVRKREVIGNVQGGL